MSKHDYSGKTILGGPGCEVCRKVQDEADRGRMEELHKRVKEAKEHPELGDTPAPADWHELGYHPNRK